jgi:hypothetical protein
VIACGMLSVESRAQSNAAGVRAADTTYTPTHVWWEGEDFARTNVPEPLAPYPNDITDEERSKLSGGTWLVPRGPEDEGPYFIEYEVDVPEAGQYSFWVRKFWKHGPFNWRFNDQPWQTCGRDIALADDTYLRKFIGANWVYLGKVELPAGRQTLRLEMLDDGGGGAIDAFLLIDGPFEPRGKLKPGQTTGDAEAGWFAFEPPADPLLDESPIDLRHLNEAEAGESGFVRRAGNGYVLGNGESVRFWIVQAGLTNMEPDMMDYHARRLAKYGVNMVRLGMSGLRNQWMNGQTEQFRENLDDLHRLVAALKKNGIYVYLGHIWWDTSVQIREEHGFEGYGDGHNALGLLFADEEARDYYVEWVDALLNTPNPYTGNPLAQEPAVAFVEVQNESSLMFWTFKPQNIVPQTRAKLERRFGQWAAEKYGSIDKALQAWPQRSPAEVVGDVSADHPDEGRLGFYDIGRLTTADWAPAQRNDKRAGDQLQFLYELQRSFYQTMIDRFRNELGVKPMIAASNWKTADPKLLGLLERLSYTESDVINRNVYFGVNYQTRPERFYAIDVGDTFQDHSALKPPALPSPLTVAHVNDHPYMITENNWTRPNRYRAEWPFLIATYAQMMGVDGWNFFSYDGVSWQTPMNVWEVCSPSVLGQFPAAALIYRRGDVTEAPAAVTEYVELEDIYDFKPVRFYELKGEDALWVSKIGELESEADAAATQADLLAFFVGKVNRAVDQGPARLETIDLDRYIDREAKRVRSVTSELSWDYETGLVAVDTRTAQGACGFLADAGPVALSDVTVNSGNDYGSVLVVALDGRPIAESRQLLVQTGTQDQPFGYATRPVGDGFKRITNLGGYPLNVKRVDGSVTIRNPRLTHAQVLDGNGYPDPDRTADLAPVDGGVRLTLPEDALYTILTPGD